MELGVPPSACPETSPFAKLGRNCARRFAPVTRSRFCGCLWASPASLFLYICILSASVAFHGFIFFCLLISSLPFLLASNLASSKQGPNGSSNPGLRSETLSSRDLRASKRGEVGYSLGKKEPSYRSTVFFTRLNCYSSRPGSSRLPRWHTWKVGNR